MAHGLGQALRRLIMLNLFASGSLTAKSAWWISLHTGDPGVDGASNEATGTGYARLNYTGGWTVAAAATPQVVTNTAIIQFAAAGGSWSSGTAISYCGIWDTNTSPVAANFIARGTLSPGQVIDNGNVPTIAAGQLSIQLTVT